MLKIKIAALLFLLQSNGAIAAPPSPKALASLITGKAALTGPPRTLKYLPINLLFDRVMPDLPENREIRASILNNIWVQAYLMKLDIDSLKNRKLTLIGHSQGGLVCLAFIALFGHEFDIERLITINAPLRGIQGVPKNLFELRTFDWYPKFLKTYTLTNETAYLMMYTPPFQRGLSIAGYWNPPKQHHIYLSSCAFLPILFGEINSDKLNQFKRNLKKLEEIICFATQEDETVVPWQSALFGATNKDDFKNTKTYKQNLLGLKEMYNNRKLHLHAGAKGSHKTVSDLKKLTTKKIVPYLDNLGTNATIVLKSGLVSRGNSVEAILSAIQANLRSQKPEFHTVHIKDYINSNDPQIKAILPKEVYNRKPPILPPNLKALIKKERTDI